MFTRACCHGVSTLTTRGPVASVRCPIAPMERVERRPCVVGAEVGLAEAIERGTPAVHFTAFASATGDGTTCSPPWPPSRRGECQESFAVLRPRRLDR